MAKWGEGDPRWIVEERPDAVNVNNWHWTEKNASRWSKDKLKELLGKLKIDEPGIGVLEITDITSIEGEAVANNRKGKLIFFYEWNIKADWKGLLNGKSEDLAVKGSIEIPNLSEENDASEIDVNVSLRTGEGSIDGDVFKEIMRNKGTQLIREQMATYIRLLREDFAKDLILPTKGSTANQPKSESNRVILNKSDCNGTVASALKPVKTDQKIEMRSLELSEKMKCRADEFYRVLTTPELVTAFCQGPIELEPNVGGKFKFFDGNVEGIFLKLEEPKLIMQKWRFKTWPSGHYSTVTINIDEKDDHTLVTIKQTDIPSNDFDRTERGWKNFYIEAIKRTFGFGAMLY
ncbi:activator of 90 kDa heat shock protein ATPase 1-like protein [Dinothrombium tinctorium]|uniref:Activator of 90 kDa heat shock protein ATPase 1-like protein n=1 Tax=Dinothrombium tinctorium TaxID=1965070 RepID=A0A443RER3_9ACAR|nr:activator of 90 kDa heat shock protein ATPase 1-like protein [Dinothrombium tinctorium]